MRDDDIERLLKAAGQRERAPARVEREVREALRADWRELVAERRGRRRAWAGFAAAAGLLLAMLGAWLAYSGSESVGRPVATMAAALDDVRVRSGWWRGWLPAEAGRALVEGDSLETGATGRAGLALPGMVSVRLDHDSRIRLAGADRIVIERGALYVDAGRNAALRSRLVVETPTGDVHHVGTQYEVRIAGDDVQLRVREGRVQWRSRKGGIESGSAGEKLTIAADGHVRREPASRYGATWDWIASTTPAISIEGRTLSEFLNWAGRELGREVVYATPAVAAEARVIVVHGSIDGLTPVQALDAVLGTTSVKSTLDDGRIQIAAGKVAHGED